MKEPHELIARPREARELETSVATVAPAAFSGRYGVDIGAEDEVHLRDYWRSIRKHLWLISGIVALITTLAGVYVARKPDIYEAGARVQVDLENSGGALGSSKSNAVILGGFGNDPVYFNTQLQILTGPGLLRRVAKTLDLEHNPKFLNAQSASNASTWQSLRRMVGLGDKSASKSKNNSTDELLLTGSVAPATSSENLAESRRLAPYVAALVAGLKVEPVKETRLTVRDTRLIDVRFTNPDPQIAAKVVNAIADVYVLSNLERKTQATNSAGDFLQKRVAELQSQIRNGEERLSNYGKTHQILSLDASQNTVVDRLTGLNKQLLEAENERKQAEAAYNAAKAPGAASALAEGDAKQLTDITGKLAELRQKRAQLLVENTEEWPEVKEVNQQIAVLEKQLQESKNRGVTVIVTNLETRYRQAVAQEQSLRSAFNQQRGETLTQNEAAINYRIIQQEIETNKTLLDSLLKTSKENDVVMAGTPNNIHIVDYAIAPDYPIGPQRLRSVLLASLLSLAFGIGLSLFLEYMDDTLRSPEDVEKMLRLPALAVIPAIGGATRRRHLLPGKGALQTRNDNRGNANSSELLTNMDPRSPLAEAYRQLRTSILLSTAGHAPKTLLVTSSLPAEGKTTTAVNAAISLAQTGASVLVIDADMRRPRIHKIFETENRRGLSTILSSEMNEAEVLSMIGQDETSGLHLLTSGPIPPNPAELLGSEQMRRLVVTLESTFTHIIIDSPPIASFTDGVLIATLVDGALLVVHGGKSTRNVVRRSRQLLQDVGAKIFGVILNNVDLRSGDYYYYQRYYQQSYYKDEVESDDFASDLRG